MAIFPRSRADEALTDLQDRIWRLIDAELKAGRSVPTRRDMAASLGKGLGTVQEACRELERKGYIEIRENKAAGIRLIRRP